MKNFKKNGLRIMNLNIKIIKNSLNQWKSIKKKTHFSNLILKYKNNTKKTWEIIKESIGKGYCNHQSFPKKLMINKENITYKGLIAKHFNTYFAQIGTNLAKATEISSIKFESFWKNVIVYNQKAYCMLMN